MIMIWNRKEVFVGSSYNDFCDVKNKLDYNKIKYRYKSVNHESSDIFGSGRGHSGSFGIRTECFYTYYIYVHEDDYELAQKLIVELGIEKGRRVK